MGQIRLVTDEVWMFKATMTPMYTNDAHSILFMFEIGYGQILINYFQWIDQKKVKFKQPEEINRSK